ncbi:hypothetical protein E8E11_001103 [Didymella keratinophila]|nr:hypothetical protein E8E11_001103 [Didymella keratinophila]
MPTLFTTSDPIPSQQPRSPSFLKRLGNFDLLNSLVFNREKVYQSLKRLSPIRTGSLEERVVRSPSIESEDRVIRSVEDEIEDEDEQAEVMPPRGSSVISSYLKSTDMAVSKPRGRPSKQALAKATPKGRMGVATTKKRGPPARTRTERASKIQKTVPKANSGKRVNGGASITDAYVISDSEDEYVDLQRRIATDSLTPPLKIDPPGTEDDLTPLPTATPAPTPSRSNNFENELMRLEVAHTKKVEEVERLRQQLSATEAMTKQTKEDAERQVLDLQRRQSITSDKQMADREEELEFERRRTSDLTWENDHLRKEMEAARSCLKGEVHLIQQRDDYERLYNEEKEAHADSVRGFEEKDWDSIRKVESMVTEIQKLGKQIEDLQREVSDLRGENAALRISADESPVVNERASPTPSMSSSQLTSASDAEVRLANMRKTYITVKKRYDNLHSVVSNISTATRSWDYGSFGEFGAYLRQLKTALNDNGPEKQVVLGSQAKNE